MNEAGAREANAEPERRIRVLVVDAEPLARQRLAVLLAGEPDVELVGECTGGAEALHAITAAHPDLVFLDVQMPELDGLGVVDALGDECPEVVFVTAHCEYMERAFEVHALDYLRKPYTNTRFHSALEHARRRVRETGHTTHLGTAPARRYTSVLASVSAERPDARVAVQDARTSTWHIIRRDEIDWIESADGTGQASVHFAGETALWRRTLMDLEQELAPYGFLRVHRCCIVNGARIRRVKPLQKGEYALILSDGTVLDSGRRYQEVVEGFLRANLGERRADRARGSAEERPTGP